LWDRAAAPVAGQPAADAAPALELPPINLPPGVPAKVKAVLRYIDEHGQAPPHYVGGRLFTNDGRLGEQVLPTVDADGEAIEYQEWDVNPRRPGVNRGTERLVTGSDSSAYYTADHYRTFRKIRGPDDNTPPAATAVAVALSPLVHLPPETSAKVNAVLAYLKVHGTAMPGYEGGRVFRNSGRDGGAVLPRIDADHHAIQYQEWDVNPRIPGVNRGKERLVTGSDGSAYYTADHYETFQRIR
jgi:guanyl-specific ribonuclease Sa